MAAPAFSAKLNNIVADLSKVVDPAWKIVGQAPGGKPVYEAIRPTFENVPDLDENGEQRYAFHPINGLPTYPKRRVKRVEKPFRFTLFDPGNGNVRQEPYVEPTPEELREREMASRKHHLMADLVHGMAEANIGVEDLLSVVQAAKQADGDGEAAPKRRGRRPAEPVSDAAE